jgi:hypothetical protein
VGGQCHASATLPLGEIRKIKVTNKENTGKKDAFRFGVPLIWRELKTNSVDCYFCCCNVKDYNSKNKKVILYPNPPSALRPVVHGPEVPVPQPTELLEDASLVEVLTPVEVMRISLSYRQSKSTTIHSV